MIYSKTTITLSYLRLLSVIVVAGVISAIAVTSYINPKFEDKLGGINHTFQRNINNSAIEQCRQNNVNKANRILGYNSLLGQKSTIKLNPILNCPLSIRVGESIKLTPKVTDQYLKIVGTKNKKPILHNGKIADVVPIAITKHRYEASLQP